MSRISIDVTPAEHQRLKAMAALQGQSIKDYVLSRTLKAPTEDEEAATNELVALLDARIERAKTAGMSKRSVDEIFQQAYSEAKSGV